MATPNWHELAKPDWSTTGLLAAAWAVQVGCLTPTDETGQLRLEVSRVPDLFVGESVRVTSRLLDPNGTPLERPVVRYESSSRFTVAVDSTGLVRALEVGEVELTASAIAFAGVAASQQVRVRTPLDVDSVRPSEVPFGGLVRIYGVGLDPQPGGSVTIGGVTAPVESYEPRDPTAPERAGVLSVFVPPPAGPTADVMITGPAGAVASAGPISVMQRSLYEPNETAPAVLGALPPAGFANPALAFTHDLTPAWYTFENPATQDVTVTLRAPTLPPGEWALLVTDSLRHGQSSCSGGTFLGYCLGSDACIEAGGSPIPLELRARRSDAVVAAFRQLPPGVYQLLVATFVPLFGLPRRYELSIRTTYTASLAPDAYEGNNFCEFAAPITIPAIPDELLLELTRDGPMDRDWFSFKVGAGGDAVRIAMASPLPSPGSPDPSLALYRDQRPQSLTRVEPTAFTVDDVTGSTATTSIYTLVAGRYLLQVIGEERAAPYTLRATRSGGSALATLSSP